MLLKYLLLVIIFQFSSLSFSISYGCPLDEPEGILNNGTFKLGKAPEEQGGHVVAIEYVQLTSNIDLYVESGGCDYVRRTYKFLVTETPPEYQISGSEYRKAIELLTLLEKDQKLKLDIPDLKISEAKEVLQKYLDIVREPRLKEVLYIRNDVESKFSEMVWVDGYRYQDNTTVRIEVTISAGPY